MMSRTSVRVLLLFECLDGLASQVYPVQEYVTKKDVLPRHKIEFETYKYAKANKENKQKKTTVTLTVTMTVTMTVTVTVTVTMTVVTLRP